MNTDPIADLLTRIRNASMASHKDVLVPYSTLKEQLVKVLQQEGYLTRHEVRTDNRNFKWIRITLKYDMLGKPIFRSLKRASKPGLRKYFKSNTIPRILNGAGVAVMSTNKGVISDRKARAEGVGGEMLCTVY